MLRPSMLPPLWVAVATPVTNPQPAPGLPAWPQEPAARLCLHKVAYCDPSCSQPHQAPCSTTVPLGPHMGSPRCRERILCQALLEGELYMDWVGRTSYVEVPQQARVHSGPKLELMR